MARQSSNLRETKMGTAFARLAVVLMACVAIVSCSSSSGPDGADPGAPAVTNVNIDDGATDVGLIQRIDVTFSQTMDASTMSNASIMVTGRAPTGHVEYDGPTHTASFIPDTLYAAELWHNFIVTSDVKSAHGVSAEPNTTSFRTGTLDNDHLNDYFEPNETPSTATPVVFNKRYRTLSLAGDADNDFYEFTLTETAKVRVAWWIKAVEDMNWAVDFCNDQGESYYGMYTTPSAGDSSDSYDFSFLPGTYYLQTRAHEGHHGHLLYDIEFSTEAPCGDDQYEDNDFLEDAAPIDPGVHADLRLCGLDVDYFAVDLAAGDTLVVGLTATGGTLDYQKRVAILTPEGTQMSWTTSNSVSVWACYTASETGTHYLYAMSWDEYVEYSLDVSRRSPAPLRRR